MTNKEAIAFTEQTSQDTGISALLKTILHVTATTAPQSRARHFVRFQAYMDGTYTLTIPSSNSAYIPTADTGEPPEGCDTTLYTLLTALCEEIDTSRYATDRVVSFRPQRDLYGNQQPPSRQELKCYCFNVCKKYPDVFYYLCEECPDLTLHGGFVYIPQKLRPRELQEVKNADF